MSRNRKHSADNGKITQLILRRIIKIVATRCQILRIKCTKFNLGWARASISGLLGETSKKTGGQKSPSAPVGAWGRSNVSHDVPQRDPGRSPGRGWSPPEAEAFFVKLHIIFALKNMSPLSHRDRRPWSWGSAPHPVKGTYSTPPDHLHQTRRRTARVRRERLQRL